MEEKLVAIHQPNFFPWLGYFNKVARADVFILLDNVQFPKTGGTWMNRVRLLIGGRASWVTMPVHRSHHGVQRVRDVRINNQTDWRTKCLKTVRQYYGHAPYFAEVEALVRRALLAETDQLADFNLAAIRLFLDGLGITPPPMVRESSLEVEGQATERLVRLVKAAGGTTYLCGGGAAGYQDDQKFASEGIRVVYQQFQHPVYRQQGSETFVAGLSIIDVLMNCGFHHTRELVLGGAREEVRLT